MPFSHFFFAPPISYAYSYIKVLYDLKISIYSNLFTVFYPNKEKSLYFLNKN